MDGLSIATAIITLVDATQKVISICQNYKAAVKGAEWELPRIIEEVGSLRGVLQGLERLAKLAENGDPAAMSQLQQLSRLCDPKTGTLALCLSELQTLERELIPPGWTGESESKRKKLIQALGWPLKKPFVKETLGNLERFKASLNLELVMIGVEGTMSVQKEIVSVGQDVGDLNESFRSMRLDDHTEKILKWLSVLDPSIKYNKTIKDRNAKTGKWLLEYEAFSKWKQTPASFLWLFGIAGCGKTILSSTVIENILDRGNSDNTLMLAYFYIDFNEDETQLPENMIRSLLKQICCQCPSAAQSFHSLYSSCANRTKQPNLDELLLVLHGLLNNKKDGEAFFVIDALDECKEREKLLGLLGRIQEQKYPKLHILVTSRQELDIEEALEPMTNHETRICIQSELVQGDILTYIHDRLENDNSLKRFKRHPTIQEKIRQTLVEKADGMFRWVACQLDSFKNCLTPMSLEKALKSLPKTLDKTYERILCGIDEQYCDYARKILYWLTYSARPLTLVEAAEIIAIDARKEPRFNPENRFFDAKEILVICSSLVSVFTGKSTWTYGSDKDVPCIKLAHFSVKEYLTSFDIRNNPAKMYAVSRELADISIAETCLALLLHFDKPNSLTSQVEEEGAPTSQSRESDHSLEELAMESPLYQPLEREFPLARYAAEHWVEHSYNASSDDDFLEGLAWELFLKRDALENWIRLSDPDDPWEDGPDLSKSSTDIGPSIYYASQAGLLKPLTTLIGTGADVNAPGGRYGSALQAACYKEHQQIVQTLLDAGADVNTQGGCYGNALQTASCRENQETVQILLDAGADVNAQGGSFGNALQAACLEGRQQIVKILLDAGADFNTLGGRYGNALHAASLRGGQQIVKILLDAGADVNTQGGRYGNALQAACYAGNQQTVQILLDAGADVNIQGGEFGSALQAASYYGYQQIVQILLDAGADVNIQGGEFRSALQGASYHGHQQIVKILLDAGADVNTQGGRDGNALQAASYHGHQQIVKMLLDAGADMNAQGGEFGSALQAAISRGHQGIVQILLDHGAHEDVKRMESDEDVDSMWGDEMSIAWRMMNITREERGFKVTPTAYCLRLRHRPHNER